MEVFSYTIAHDWRAPLRAMRGFSQVLLQDYQQALDPIGRDFLQRIGNSNGAVISNRAFWAARKPRGFLQNFYPAMKHSAIFIRPDGL